MSLEGHSEEKYEDLIDSTKESLDQLFDYTRSKSIPALFVLALGTESPASGEARTEGAKMTHVVHGLSVGNIADMLLAVVADSPDSPFSRALIEVIKKGTPSGDEEDDPFRDGIIHI